MPRDLLKAEGFRVGRKHMTTLVRRMGITALYRKPDTSRKAPREHDVSVPAAHADDLALEPSLGDGHHAPHIERPELFAQAVRGFFQGNELCRATNERYGVRRPEAEVLGLPEKEPSMTPPVDPGDWPTYFRTTTVLR